MFRILNFLNLVFTLVLMFSCNKDEDQKPAEIKVTDIDGNLYSTVTIGTQVWMKENLKVSRYRNGDPLPTNLTDAEWSSTTNGACAVYDNDATNNTAYGKLYIGYAVADPRGLCPAGWHVPNDAEWKTLEGFLGMPVGELDATGNRGIAQNVGGKLKAASGWAAPNTSADNSSGFTGFPGGYRNYDGDFKLLGSSGFWATSPESPSTLVWYRSLSFNNGSSDRNNGGSYSGTFGYSIRCVRD